MQILQKVFEFLSLTDIKIKYLWSKICLHTKHITHVIEQLIYCILRYF